MSYPKELWENTPIPQKTYPIQLFRNQAGNRQTGDNILFLHWHEHLELIVMRSGHALFHIDSRSIEAGPGDVLLVPGGSLHVGYAQAEGHFLFDCIVFNASLFGEWVNDPVHVQLAAPYLEGKQHFPIRLSREEGWEERFEPELQDIVEELTAKETGYQLIVKAKLYAWFVRLARCYAGMQPTTRQTETYFANRDRFKLLIDWIERHYAEKLTVREASEIVRLDPFHFCKQFKKLTGRTFIEYVNVCRTNEAERLLMRSQATISEIAVQVGCENANYFTKLYKQYKGMTPSEVRRRAGG